MLPQILYLLLIFVSLGISMANHGKPRSNESFWTTLIATVLTLSLLTWGGFFDKLLGIVR